MKLKIFACFSDLLRNARRRWRERPSQRPFQPRQHDNAPRAPSDKDLERHPIDHSFPLGPGTRLFITRTSESIKAEQIQTSEDIQQIQVSPAKPTPTVSIPYQTQVAVNDHLSPGSFSTRSSRHGSISTHRSSSRDSSYSRSSTAGDSLGAQLRRARVECHQRPHSFIVPICDQESLITVENVEKDIQARDHRTELAEIRRVAGDACRTSPKFYAILACLKKGQEIFSFLRDGISDGDLPLRRKKVHGDFVLKRKSGGIIKAFQGWNDSEIEEFDRIQWWMISPVFEDKAHYELESGTILPFVPYETNPETAGKREGGNSEVYAARIHPSHHNFWASSGPLDNEPLVAIKRLFSSEKIEFDKEVTILKALGSKEEKHPHLITLLATFNHKSKYHLVFPYANANLRKYWEDQPNPNLDKAVAFWSLHQMAGLADGLESVHNFSVKYPLLVGDGAREKSEALFGRHGDIKPENILWFQKTPETRDEKGILQLADFGLGRFHGPDSRSKVPSEQIDGGSPTYEPPECKLHRPVSRAYDIWSLGCVYLEFATWLLMGSLEIAAFSATRHKIDPITGMDDNRFFTIINGGKDAVLRKEVITWVKQLHEHEKCSLLMHDLLDLITGKLLVPDSKGRTSAKLLHHRLHELIQRATTDKDYLLKPAARPPQLKSDQMAPAEFPIFHPRRSNTKATVCLDFPRDLVGRVAGTPGLLRRSQTDGMWLRADLLNG